MSNEEKILSMLTQMQSDLKIMQADIELLKSKNGIEEKKWPSAAEQIAILDAMSALLTQEEKDALGRYQKSEEARKNAFFNHDTWLLPCNPNYYEVDAAFRELKIIEWRQAPALKNIRLGDFAYIYVSSPVRAIHWKCRVNIVNVETSEIDDRRFWRNLEIYDGSFIWLEALREYSAEKFFSYENLRKNGLNSPLRSPRKVKGQLLKYLETVDEMVEKNERNKKRY